MIRMRCKCGDAWVSTSMGTHPCQGCEKCRTTYAGHPSYHRDLQPHTWETRYHERTGKAYQRCQVCDHVDRASFKEAGKA